MPIGIGLGIAGVGAVASAAIGSSATGKASDAATAAADRSAAVVERNYDRSAQALAPWQQSGLRANSAIDDFLGTGAPQQALPTPQPNALAQFDPGQFYGGDFGGFGGGYYGDFGQFFPQGITFPQQQQPAAQQPVDSREMFRKYIEKSDYGFKFGEGANQVNSGYAGAGTLQSGAAMKALEEYRQSLQQGYRGEFLGALGNQQALGASAASAQAGVSQNVGNSLADIYTRQGDNIANAALVGGRNTANSLDSFTTLAGSVLGRGR